MTAIERTAYPRFKNVYSLNELRQLYRPTADELAFITATSAEDATRLRLLVLIKVFQSLAHFPRLEMIPSVIVDYLRSQLGITPDVRLTDQAPTNLHKYHSRIRRYMRVVAYRDGGESVAKAVVLRALNTMDQPVDLINVALEELIRQRFTLPAFSTLDRLVNHLRQVYNDALFRHVAHKLTPEERKRLDKLLLRRPNDRQTPFTQLKQPPGPANLTHMQELLDQLIELTGMMDTNRLLKDIPPSKIVHFAAQAHALEISDFTALQKAKYQALALCLLNRAQVTTHDNLITTFIKRMKRMHNSGKAALEKVREVLRQLSEHAVDTLGEVVKQAAAVEKDAPLGRAVREVLERAGGIERLLADYELLAAYHDENYYILLPRFYKSHRSTLFRFITQLEIRPTSQDTALKKALTLLRTVESVKAEWIPASISFEFVSQKWRKVLLRKEKNGTVLLNRKMFEICVFSYIAAELQTGDLFVTGSEEYADYREQLLPWEECLPRLKEYCEGVGLPQKAGDFVRSLQKWMSQTLRDVDRQFKDQSPLSFDKDGHPTLPRLKKQKLPDALGAIQTELERRMPERPLLDTLIHAHHWIDFTRHFGPPSESDPKLRDAPSRYLLTVFGYGCHLGAAQTARHARQSVSPRALSLTNRQHITSAKLDAAIRDVINCYRRLDLPNYWGTGIAAAADGTQFDLYRHNLLVEYHIRYGGYGGIAYHHVADSYIALFSHFIACGVWEAVYIIDGLLKNTSEVQPEELHADTHGQSEPVFGLAHMLGIRLMPRIRNWKKLTFYRPHRSERYPHIDGLLTKTINWTLIETHWQDLMQVVISIRAGKVLPSMLLRKLNSYSRKNHLYSAFAELGCVIRTIFLMHYMTNDTLRRRVDTTTNKVEAYHHFSNWVSFGGHREIETNDPIEQEKRIKYTDLVANIVILQNAVDMTNTLRELAHEGYTITPEILGRLSPYITEHIRRFGDYLVNIDLQPPPLELDTPLFTS